jgi:hypothetical protein
LKKIKEKENENENLKKNLYENEKHLAQQQEIIQEMEI